MEGLSPPGQPRPLYYATARPGSPAAQGCAGRRRQPIPASPRHQPRRAAESMSQGPCWGGPCLPPPPMLGIPALQPLSCGLNRLPKSQSSQAEKGPARCPEVEGIRVAWAVGTALCAWSPHSPGVVERGVSWRAGGCVWRVPLQRVPLAEGPAETKVRPESTYGQRGPGSLVYQELGNGMGGGWLRAPRPGAARGVAAPPPPWGFPLGFSGLSTPGLGLSVGRDPRPTPGACLQGGTWVPSPDPTPSCPHPTPASAWLEGRTRLGS